MDFDQRLQKAITRGEQTRNVEERKRAEKLLSEEEFRNLHSQYRLELSEHIEACLRKLADHFLGFQYQTVVNEDGWGAKVSRDDLSLGSKRSSANLFSRFELLIRPFSSAHIVELVVKGTIHNKEVMNSNHFQFLAEADLDSLRAIIDQRVLEYAEFFAAKA
jgi:hypothetical protein